MAGTHSECRRNIKKCKMPPYPKLSGLAAFAFATLIASQAQAAFPCTWAEGEYQVGENNGTPLCERQEDLGGGGGGAAAPHLPQDAEGDALAAQNKMLASDIIAALQATENRAKLEKQLASNPVYKRMKAGYWEFLPRPKGSAKGDGCAATFFNLKGGVTIAGPNGNFRQAALTFFGGSIPVPNQDRKIRVTLTQSGGDPPATVEVLHDATGSLGSVTFTVPSAPALVQGLTDKSSFAVAYKQQPWHKISWTKGNAARQYMTKCLAGS